MSSPSRRLSSGVVSQTTLVPWVRRARPVCYISAQVTSTSVKPRLAGRQPSFRGGVPRVRTRSRHDRVGQARTQEGAAVERPTPWVPRPIEEVPHDHRRSVRLHPPSPSPPGGSGRACAPGVAPRRHRPGLLDRHPRRRGPAGHRRVRRLRQLRLRGQRALPDRGRRRPLRRPAVLRQRASGGGPPLPDQYRGLRTGPSRRRRFPGRTPRDRRRGVRARHDRRAQPAGPLRTRRLHRGGVRVRAPREPVALGAPGRPRREGGAPAAAGHPRRRRRGRPHRPAPGPRGPEAAVRDRGLQRHR